MNQLEVHRSGAGIIVSVYMLTTWKHHRFFSFTNSNIHVARKISTKERNYGFSEIAAFKTLFAIFSWIN